MTRIRQSATRIGYALAILSVAFAPLSASAQDGDTPAQDGSDDIVVEGVLDVDGVEVLRQAREITAQRSSTAKPLARFNTPICPGIWGLAPENAQLLVDRINEDADCRANIWVIFVDDPHASYHQMRIEDAFLMQGVNIWESRRILEQEGPALAWNATILRNNEGISNSTSDAAINQVSSMSRLDTGMRNDIEIAVLLMERSVLARLDAYALADYATMRLLADTRAPETKANMARSCPSWAQRELTKLPPPASLRSTWPICAASTVAAAHRPLATRIQAWMI
ncbi:hypothetical protein [Aurantiacibacter atlanticus]|uniref:hypothetical protein n=1 Tax=Aurantiacibacter atlanticus TaxID=1648404 RepID=UPI0007C55C86|nr:hypothetical protein [Aurantiacibacter atlanticus]